MPEGLSATEVGKEIAEHSEHAVDDARRDRIVSIVEASSLRQLGQMHCRSDRRSSSTRKRQPVVASEATSSRSPRTPPEHPLRPPVTPIGRRRDRTVCGVSDQIGDRLAVLD